MNEERIIREIRSAANSIMAIGFFILAMAMFILYYVTSDSNWRWGVIAMLVCVLVTMGIGVVESVKYSKYKKSLDNVKILGKGGN